MKNNHSGFTLFELLLVIGIIAALMAMTFSRVQRSTPRYERETFIARLNALLFLGWQNAIKTSKIHRISCNLGTRKITVATATNVLDIQSGEPTFELLTGKYGRTTVVIPETIKIENFIIEGYDELSKYTSKQTAESWFYLTPNGLAQEVTINFFDTKDRLDKKPRPIGLVLNPFSAQFEIHDTFQK